MFSTLHDVLVQKAIRTLPGGFRHLALARWRGFNGTTVLIDDYYDLNGHHSIYIDNSNDN